VVIELIIEKLEQLCLENKTNITALCKEITGSTGNLNTWRKDNIKPKWLKAICEKFNVSSDYLLEIDTASIKDKATNMSEDESDLLTYFRQLTRKNQRAILVQMENMLDVSSVVVDDSKESEPKKSLA